MKARSPCEHRVVTVIEAVSELPGSRVPQIWARSRKLTHKSWLYFSLLFPLLFWKKEKLKASACQGERWLWQIGRQSHRRMIARYWDQLHIEGLMPRGNGQYSRGFRNEATSLEVPGFRDSKCSNCSRPFRAKAASGCRAVWILQSWSEYNARGSRQGREGKGTEPYHNKARVFETEGAV